MEPQIIADLRTLFRQPYSREAFAAALPPPELDAPTRYHKALCLPLVRCQVQMRWESLWESCPDYAERRRDLRREEWEQNIERTAQSVARWIRDHHLPAEQETVIDMAVVLRRELVQLLQPTADPDSPPPLPTPQFPAQPVAKPDSPNKLGGWIWRDDEPSESGNKSTKSMQVGSQPVPRKEGVAHAAASAPPRSDKPGEEPITPESYSVGWLLRRKPIRDQIIAERERRAKAMRKDTKRSWHDYRDNMRLNRILVAALDVYLKPLLGGSIAHRIQFIADQETETEKAANQIIERAAVLLRSPWVPVVRSGHGLCEMRAAAFLHASYERAKSSPQIPPACETIGTTQPARRARDCSKILLFLGDCLRRYLSCEAPEFVSLNDIVRAVKDATGGKHYKRIKLLLDGLVELGLVAKSGAGGKAGWRFWLAPQIANLQAWKGIYAGRSSIREKVK